MSASISRVSALLCCLFLAGCASRSLPKYQKPIALTPVQHVRTTAYTHSESDHRAYGRRTALGTTLRAGPIHSAAADWSRWPVGTTFRIRETGRTYQVDDYGWALAGTNTIDLYKTSRGAMNRWGVRHVTIDILRWGDVDRSLAILRPRSKYKHIRRMIDQIEDRYSQLKRPAATASYASLPEPVAAAPDERRTAAASGVTLTPFSASLSP